MKHALLVIAFTAISLGACAPAAAPTADPVQVQASAMAVARTMIALTQAALPTATAVPPTPLPSPTAPPSPTLETLPTLSIGGSPTAQLAGTASDDPCKGLMSSNPAGPLTTFKIVNANRAPVTVSIGLAAKTPFGECGFRSFALGPMDSVYSTDFPQGCYWAFAYVNDPKKPSQASGPGTVCANNDDKWTFVVQAEVIKFYSP